jgi:integrase
MAIKKHQDGSWVADVRPNGITGKRYRKAFKTKGEANRWVAWLTSNKQEDKTWNPKQKDRRRVSELIDIWFRLHGSQLKDGEGRKRLLYYLAEKVGDPLAADFTPGHFTRYRETRLQDGVSPNTVNHEHAYLRAMFNELERLGEWVGNPLGKIRQLKIDESELTFLTTEQIQTLLDHLSTPKRRNAYLFVCTALATGGRYSEILNLHADNIRKNSVTFEGTKSGKNRSVPISKDLFNMIQPHDRGKPFHECVSTLQRVFPRAGIKPPAGQLTHIFRHTFASHFMMNGGNILALQKLLGHGSLTMTMRYAHLGPDHLQEVVSLNPMANLLIKKQMD